MHAFKTILTSSLFLFALFIIPASTNAQVIVDSPTNFITTWNTENPGSSGSNQITIPGTGTGYSYELYWEDTTNDTINGTTTLITTDSHTQTFPNPGIYEVQVSGTFPRIYFNNGGDKDKILTVEQWGDSAWTSMANALYGATNVRIPAVDAPDLSAVTDMLRMFSGATSFNDPIEHWNVSNVESFQELFLGAENFNQPVDGWNTSKVTNMAMVFSAASSFNQPLNNWNTASATNMFRMFRDASAFNQDISMWDVSNVTQMTQMFRNTPFNQPIGAWDTSSLQYTVEMFVHNTAFDQDLSNWDISSIQVDGAGWWTTQGMTSMLRLTTLSTPNQNATLASWAQQATDNDIRDIPLHIGTKSYTEEGALAVQTLRDLGWTITEQYKAEYYPSANAALFGDNVQTGLSPGDATTQVRLTPQRNCTFVQWSDGNTQNPRTDTIGTNNLRVTAELSCPSNTQTSTSARTQRDRSLAAGNLENAERVEERFLDGTTPYQAPATLEESLDEVRAIPELFANLDPVRDAETINVLIELLLEMIQVLMQLLLVVQEEGVVE